MGHAQALQSNRVNTVAVNRLLFLGIGEDAWNFEMIGIKKCLIDPGFQGARGDFTFNGPLNLDIGRESYVIMFTLAE